MKPSSQSPRTPSRLSDSVHRQISQYALAASAAGVGMLALAQPAEAKIVYTPANKMVPRCSGHPRLCLKLDLNHDNTIDFTFTSVSHGTGSFRTYASVGIKGAPKTKNAVRGIFSYTLQKAFAQELNSGAKIGQSGGKFYRAAALYGFSRDGGSWGQWRAGSCCPYSSYLGLKFYIEGKAHYGWARVYVEWGYPPLTLTGYAYETIPNKPIVAGKTKGPDVITLVPGSLGRLALGSVGLAAGCLGK